MCLYASALDNQDLSDADLRVYRGKLQTTRYYFQWEQPEIDAQASLLKRMDSVTIDMQDEWFQGEGRVVAPSVLQATSPVPE